VAQRRTRGGKLLMWTRVPVEPGPEALLYGPRGDFAGSAGSSIDRAFNFNRR
jgi:hypothetical protein